MDFELAYSLERDGYSYITFFNKLKAYECYLLILKDTLGHVFGALITEPILEQNRAFVGHGEAFVFTFGLGDDVRVFHATGLNDKY